MGRLSYDMLYVLVGAAPNVFTQDEFARGVWAGRLATPDTMAQRVGD
jgi:DNA-binding winged helix-turn-helix (wHTH) protein